MSTLGPLAISEKREVSKEDVKNGDAKNAKTEPAGVGS
jgi:hypothetical protein